MQNHRPASCTAFCGSTSIASGDLDLVTRKAKETIDRGTEAAILIFDDETSALVEIDFRGTADDVSKRLADSAQAVTPSIHEEPARRGPGRPKLGVVGGEVTLLPRHWEWLKSQPGGASVTLRKLVETAKKANVGKDRVRRSQDAAYRFLSAIAGDYPGFEEATRALFAADEARFDQMVALWPPDIRDHAKRLAEIALRAPDETTPG